MHHRIAIRVDAHRGIASARACTRGSGGGGERPPRRAHARAREADGAQFKRELLSGLTFADGVATPGQKVTWNFAKLSSMSAALAWSSVSSKMTDLTPWCQKRRQQGASQQNHKGVGPMRDPLAVRTLTVSEEKLVRATAAYRAPFRGRR